MIDEDKGDITAARSGRLRVFGTRATDELRQRAELAVGIGDRAAAEAWLEIADVAEELLQAG